MKSNSLTSLLLICLIRSSGVLADIRYVSTDSPVDGPGTTWSNAFHMIQSAIDVSVDGDTVQVGDGLYSDGGATVYGMNNRVALTNAVTIQSVNGPEHSFIMGAGPVGSSAIRCAYLANGATLSGFTLTNGYTHTAGDINKERCGGGVWLDNGGTIDSCIIAGNSADSDGGGAYCYTGGTLTNCTFTGNSATDGGGAYCHYGGTLTDCTFTGNSADTYGGGAYCYYGGTFNKCTLTGNSATAGGGIRCYAGGELNNCVMAGNSAESGGGVYCYSGGKLNHCTVTENSAEIGGGIRCFYAGAITNTIVWGNSAHTNSPNWAGIPTMDHCSTLPVAGSSHVADDPFFLDPASQNYRLGYGSPCIDAGAALAGVTADRDGNTRPVDGDMDSSSAYDIGAYEYDPATTDTDGDGLTDGAEVSIHGTSPLSGNTDGDAATDFEEYIADTDGTNSNEWFYVTSMTTQPSNSVRFISSAARQYTLLYCTNLTEGVWSPVPAQTVMGTGGEISLGDSGSDPACFYRVEVEIP